MGEPSSAATVTKGDSETEPEYYFESDPLVLKNNTDYQQLLRCQLKLQAQRTVAVKNLEQLLELWDYGVKNPMQFVDDFSAARFNLPDAVTPEEVPAIDWSKYNLSGIGGTVRRNTRNRVAAARAAAAATPSAASRQQSAVPTVRGRPYNSTKPQSFNQPWTLDEQKRLDELLVIFPPEDIAANRYRKIAEELGTRSAMQVQSRVQNYSIALKKNKIVLPGYNPSPRVMRKLGGTTGSSRRRTVNSLSCLASFLGPQDLESQSGRELRSGTVAPKLESAPDAFETLNFDHERSVDEVDVELSGSANVEQVRLVAMKRLKSYKKTESQRSHGMHYTYTCVICRASPIEGVRQHCLDCSSNLPGASSSSVDFCDRCHESCVNAASTSSQPANNTKHPLGLQHDAQHHSLSHKVQEFAWMHIKSTLPRIMNEIDDRL